MDALKEEISRDYPEESASVAFKPTECYKHARACFLGSNWITMLRTGCDFDADGFFKVVHYLIRNPNVTSSTLFRADILYDSDYKENVDVALPDLTPEQLKRECPKLQHVLSHDRLRRQIIRRFVPRNDGLDKPMNQSVFYYTDSSLGVSVVIMVPHVELENMPFYHPKVAGVAFIHSTNKDSVEGNTVSVAYSLPPQNIDQPLANRESRTALHLLKTVWKHGQGSLKGYEKRVHHDQIVPQQRVQDRFAALKRKYAARLINNWVEVTDPKKQVFEQIGIAAFLLELWDDMYAATGDKTATKPAFPGFVDIGCGNGVLLEILLSEGRPGWGLEGHNRKTWATLSSKSQKAIVHGLFVPAPLNYIAEPDNPKSDFGASDNPTPDNSDDLTSITKRFKSLSGRLFNASNKESRNDSGLPPFHNGIFNISPELQEGPFIISNHADQLTGWTPFLALLNRSSFFAVPCCSRNLSGEKFRAPSHGNNWTTDAAAPTYFSNQKSLTANGQTKKHIAIHIPTIGTDQAQNSPTGSRTSSRDSSPLSRQPDIAHRYHFVNAAPLATPPQTSTTQISSSNKQPQAAESGDLKALSQRARSKKLTGYQALCCWVVHLADKCGYLVEREILRVPSTRNYGIVCRFRKGDVALLGRDDSASAAVDGNEEMTPLPATANLQERMERAMQIVAAEGGADRDMWVSGCRKDVIKGSDLAGHAV